VLSTVKLGLAANTGSSKTSQGQQQLLLVVEQKSQQVLSTVKVELVANTGFSRTNQGQQQVLAIVIPRLQQVPPIVKLGLLYHFSQLTSPRDM
jgi:hypothetical protein